MEIHEVFTEWAEGRGVKINGVAAHKFEGRGLGIITTRKLEANSALVTVPISALRTVHTVPKALAKAIGPITVHGLLAADLCLTPLTTGTGSTALNLAPWRAVLPTMADFQSTMPLLYPPSLQTLLPSAAKTLLDNQNRKLNLDWAAVSSAYPDLEYEKYLHAWLLINTRTFYFVSPKAKTTPKDRDDCMALNPFADYFNHCSAPAPTPQEQVASETKTAPEPATNSDSTSNSNSKPNPTPCDVSFTPAGYEITTPVPLARGAEVYISYGTHSNDFLLAEYGFILSSSLPRDPNPSSTPNHYDELLLDAYVLDFFAPHDIADLEDAGFLGRYTLDAREICYRTQTALRLVVMPTGRWKRLAAGFEEDAEKYQADVDALLVQALTAYRKDARKNFKDVVACTEGLPEQRDILSRRWKQIEVLLDSAIDRIKNS